MRTKVVIYVVIEFMFVLDILFSLVSIFDECHTVYKRLED